MDRSSILFCAGSLVACLAVAAIAFPFAALDPETVVAAKTPQPAENLPVVDVGQGFGELPVEELMMYYIENPPAPAASAGASAPAIKFGGC